MAGELPEQCRLSCPLNGLAPELIPEGLRRNCRGPAFAGSEPTDETYRIRLGSNGEVESVEDSALEVGELACMNEGAKLAFGLTERRTT